MKKSPLYLYTELIAELLVQYLPGSPKNELVNAASEMFCNGKKPAWLRAICHRVANEYSDAKSRPLIGDVAATIRYHPSFRQAYHKGKIDARNYPLIPAKMLPAPGRPEQWPVPAATHTAALAKLIELHTDDLGWLLSRNPECRHYHLKWHRKKNGTDRLIEIPKPLLKETQQIILGKILNTIPVHESACGFCRGKSVIDFVAPHCQQQMVLKMDLKNFFPSITSGRVRHLFLAAGYPETIAGILSDLCTHRIDDEDLANRSINFNQKRLYAHPHLPQGTPTSPTIANLIAYRLDCRLSGLARSANINYTRYADDLLFSGGHEFAKQAKRFHLSVLSIILEEGFQINTRKTRFMRASQKQFAAGLVINQKPNIDRRAYDQLKAILTNCLRNGIEAENHDSHPEFHAVLRGKIEWVRQSNVARGEKLWSIFRQIECSNTPKTLLS